MLLYAVRPSYFPTHPPAQFLCTDPLLVEDENVLKETLANTTEWLAGTEIHRLVRSDMNYQKWKWFSLLGEVQSPCKEIQQFAELDDAKWFCFTEEMLQEGCSVFSIGSNNQWGFESAIAVATRCNVFTFDCFVDKFSPPEQLNGRLKTFPLCLSNHTGVGSRFSKWYNKTLYFNVTNYEFLLEMNGWQRPTFLKMDIEGSEYMALRHIFNVASKFERETGKQLFPNQIAFEIHVDRHSKFDLECLFKMLFYEGEFWRLFVKVKLIKLTLIFFLGGYVLAGRHDNAVSEHCSELLFVRVACGTTKNHILDDECSGRSQSWRIP